jgi:hypothetical protein
MKKPLNIMDLVYSKWRPAVRRIDGVARLGPLKDIDLFTAEIVLGMKNGLARVGRPFLWNGIRVT